MKKYGAGLFLSPKNTREGDIITFNGEYYEGDFDGKPNVTFEVELDGDMKKITINPTSVQNLAEVWGWDCDDWIGKSAKVTFVEKPIQDQLTKYIVLEPVETAKTNASAESTKDEDIPVIETEEKDMVNKPDPKKKVKTPKKG